MSRGRFITFEGGEGAGKSTQVRRLCEALESAGVVALRTREPGGAPGAEAIRGLLVSGDVGRWDPVAETLLHVAARREHTARVIEPALSRGDWVVCDRFADSTLAYQGFAQGVPEATIRDLHRVALGDFGPDLTLVLDLPPELGFERVHGRQDGGSRYDALGLEAHRRIRDAFLAIAARNPHRCVVIDASVGADAVHAQIRRAVSERLGIAI